MKLIVGTDHDQLSQLANETVVLQLQHFRI